MTGGPAYRRRAGCTRFRDEARARVASAPPDAGFGNAGRRRWRHRVGRLARLLDELEAQGGDDAGLRPLLLLGFRAVLPLADPGWWRAHPKARLNAAVRRQLRRIDKQRRQGTRRGWAETGLGRLGLRVTGAAAIYTRHRDGAAFDLCVRMLNDLNRALTGPGCAGGREGAPGETPGEHKTAVATATTPGRRMPAPGKEVEV